MKPRCELDIRMAGTLNGDLEVTLSDIYTGDVVESFLSADVGKVVDGSIGGMAELDEDTGELRFTLGHSGLKN